MLASDFTGTKLYRAPAQSAATGRDGLPRQPKRLGKIHFPVFTPDGRRAVGFMVKLPDVVGMIKRPDRFVALDALDLYEGALCVRDEKQSYDADAAKRLGIDLDACIVWTGMNVRSVSGTTLGYCADVSFNANTGAVNHYVLTTSGASSMLVGNLEMPASFVRGYAAGTMIVSDEACKLQFTGGAAARAAEASVAVKDTVKRGAQVLDEHGSRAVEKGSRALGRQLGKSKGMFRAFAKEFKDASR